MWLFYEAPVAAAVSGSRIDLGEFQRSVRFFERVTLVTYEEGSDIGKVPRPSLRLTLETWRLWFRSNQKDLRFDPISCTLTRMPEGPLKQPEK